MSTRVVYLHGIGGATPGWRWIEALNNSLVSCGFDRLLPEDVIDFDYAPLLDNVVTGNTDEPPTTISKGKVDDRWESEFLSRRYALQSWIANARLEESSWTPPVPQGAGQLGRLIPQVRNYLSFPEVRHAIWNKVIDSMAGHSDVVIVGHSLGSVIAADVVSRLPPQITVRALITVASPLCWGALGKHSQALRSTESFPFERVRAWVNVFEPRDVVAFRRGIASRYPMALDVDISTGPLPGSNHDVGLYVAHPVVAYAVGSAVWGAGLPAVRGHVPARRIDPSFRFVLLKHAYAQSFSEVIPAQEGERRRQLRLLRELKAREAAAWAAGLGMDPTRVPTESDFLHHAAECLKGEITMDEVVPLAIQLAAEPLFPPFSTENGWDSEVRLDALDRLFLRLEPTGLGVTDSRQIAQMCMDALGEARRYMKVRDGAGLLKWALIAGVGVAAIAGTVVTLGALAPATLAGAAAITATLAAFGPGGMVGGIVTIAAITSAGAVAAGAGAVGGLSAKTQQDQRQAEQMRAEMRAAVAAMVLDTEPEQLRVMAAALISAVAAQEELDKREPSDRDSGREEVYRTLLHVQTEVQAQRTNVDLIDPKGHSANSLRAKAEIVELALGWFRVGDNQLKSLESALKDGEQRIPAVSRPSRLTRDALKRRMKETLRIESKDAVSDRADVSSSLTDEIRNRVAGVLVASACGDALGAGYEFDPPERIPAQVAMVGGGVFGWEPGEWTDDTSMAWVTAEVAASGVDLRSQEAQDRIAAGWYTWMREAKDVGAQTSAVLSAGARGLDVPTAATLRREAAAHHERNGRSGGNGSLMRTAPVALAYLGDPVGLVEAATQISALTHFDPEAGQACVLQCLAIRHAVLTGVLDLRVGLAHLESDAAALWAERIADAESRAPETFSSNGWVVEALLGAWSSIASTADHEGQHLRLGLEAAVRGGNDTDTVATIAGALLGAKYGLSAVPENWRRILHGWPGKNADDLTALARRMPGTGTVGASQAGTSTT